LQAHTTPLASAEQLLAHMRSEVRAGNYSLLVKPSQLTKRYARIKDRSFLHESIVHVQKKVSAHKS
jgi:hypothetical protein